MKEIRYSAKIQEQQTLSDAKGVGPDIDKLKDKFKEGSIPLQTDFNQLIDIADIGRKATGQAPNQKGPAKGMRLGEDGLLQLKLSENDESYVDGRHSPLILHEDVLVVGVGKGLMTYQGAHEIGVVPGDGLKIDGDKVAVKLADNKGLVVDSNGIAIKPGNGMKFSSDGALSVGSADSTIKVDGSGIKVSTGWGVKVGGEGLDVNIRTDGGIGNGSSGIYVKPGNGIKIDADRVAIDPNTVLPKGMIMMFSGKDIPVGWALCDGSKGTPDLINRFIMGGTIQNIHGKSSNTFSGDKNSKRFTFTSESQSVRISGRTDGHRLTAEQNGSHYHVQGETYIHSEFCHDGSLKKGETVYVSGGNTGTSSITYAPYTYNSGKGDPHSHGIDLTSGEHSHNNSVTVPYYILAFIMKL
ncbi:MULTISPECIES: tail fiber protein [Xenorhabdus]|uniref:tail fiber protein n=1 Tax=Xenorhabdus TaxID=626 RepID=UPI000645F93A|nr:MULTISPECIES: tail fiber protein [Xenorhabdus]